MNVRTLCLAILNFGDASGYEIKKLSTESHFSYFMDASFGSIYPALTRLEQDGRVTAREEREPGKPVRKVYSITPSGRDELVEQLGETPREDIFKSEFLMVAMCAELVDRETIVRAVDQRIEWIKGELSQVDDALSNSDHPGTHWIAKYGRACMAAGLEHIEKHRHELEALAQGTSHPAEAAE